MKKIAMWISLGMGILVGSSASAFDFSQADTFFKQRENNSVAIANARALYEQALGSANKEERIYAVERLGKLAYYEGELLTSQNDSTKRVTIFSKCLENVEAISPEKIGRTGAYYYWKTACLALWGRAAGMFSAASRLGELKESMKEGLALDPDYQSGGMHRVVATIKLRATWFSGLRDYEGALQQIELAIAKGPEYFNVYIVKAEILKALDRGNEALVVLETAKKNLEKLKQTNQWPANLEPESKIFLTQIKEALRN